MQNDSDLVFWLLGGYAAAVAGLATFTANDLGQSFFLGFVTIVLWVWPVMMLRYFWNGWLKKRETEAFNRRNGLK